MDANKKYSLTDLMKSGVLMSALSPDMTARGQAIQAAKELHEADRRKQMEMDRVRKRFPCFISFRK